MLRRAFECARRDAVSLATAAVAVIAVAGCTDTTDTSNTLESAYLPMSVVVDPVDFVTDVACADRPGAMKSYVATITDATEEESSFTLPSSPPISCSQPVFFRYVLIDHVYTAKIEAYEERPDELVPVGGLSSGNSHMLSVATGAAVTPRWTAACGFAAVAQLDTTVAIGGCELEDAGMSVTEIEVDPNLTLGALGCAPGGTVTSFDVHPTSGSLGAYNGSACGAAPVAYTVGIEHGVEYTFTILAYEGGAAEPTLQSTCFAVAQAGISVPAFCDPLSPITASP